MTPLERAMLDHAHKHHIDGEPWGDTEALFGRPSALVDAKAEWLAEQHPDVDPELTKHYYDRRNIDWDELDRSTVGCAYKLAWKEDRDGHMVPADTPEDDPYEGA